MSYWKHDLSAEDLKVDLDKNHNEIVLGQRHSGERLVNKKGFGHWHKAEALEKLTAALEQGKRVDRYQGSNAQQYYIIGRDSSTVG